jgi:hypothetical protein
MAELKTHRSMLLVLMEQHMVDWLVYAKISKCGEHGVSGGKIRGHDQYIEIDFLNLTKITGIATHGREYNGGRETVENYAISYRKDGGEWHFYRGIDQSVKVNLIKIFHG